MADIFKLLGAYTTQPTSGSPSGDPEVSAPLSESVGLVRKSVASFNLTADTATVIPLNGLTQVNVLVVKTIGGKVRLRITSADGTTQAIPVDSFYASISLSVPITAIDVTRVAGQQTTVRAFLGERA